jgi:DNA-binding transcriptional MerR regulator
MEEGTVRIGELSARTGASVRSLRYYEEQGLLTSVRSSGAQRHYRDADVERVRLLQRLYDAGLSSRTIAALLPCVDAPGAEASDDAYARMVEERDRLDAHIADLARTRDSLDAVIATNRRTRSGPSAHRAPAGGTARSTR